jgi:hypothetical protein
LERDLAQLSPGEVLLFEEELLAFLQYLPPCLNPTAKISSKAIPKSRQSLLDAGQTAVRTRFEEFDKGRVRLQFEVELTAGSKAPVTTFDDLYGAAGWTISQLMLACGCSIKRCVDTACQKRFAATRPSQVFCSLRCQNRHHQTQFRRKRHVQARTDRRRRHEKQSKSY